MIMINRGKKFQEYITRIQIIRKKSNIFAYKSIIKWILLTSSRYAGH